MPSRRGLELDTRERTAEGSDEPMAMKLYPGRLYHRVPGWVGPGSVFHIRLRCHPGNPLSLVDARIGHRLMESVVFYSERRKWFHHLFLLMPDHIHALLSFPEDCRMGQVIGKWKEFHCRAHGILWQEGYFDHRIRNQDELVKKAAYIRKNPVIKGLCDSEEDWIWRLDNREKMDAIGVP